MRIRLIDYDEHLIVVTVNPDGKAAVSHPTMCAVDAAAWLERLAAVMRAEHPPHACDPAQDAEPEEREPEPLLQHGGSLADDRRTWFDGTGHAWDLGVVWRDVVDVEWRWVGRMDESGAPLMRSSTPGDVQSLDVIRAVVGPIVPVRGDDA